MDSTFSLQTAFTDVLQSLSESFSSFMPRALTALVVFLVGLLLAKVISKIIRTAFERLKIDDLLVNVGLTDILKKLGLHEKPGFMLSRLVYYLLILLFTQSAANAVGLNAISGSITAFFNYLPHFVAASIVLIIGMLIAQFAGGAVSRSAKDSGIEFGPILGRIVSSLIVFLAGLMAVTQLRIDTEIIHSVVLILLAGAALALALTFGLGTREITRNLVAGFYIRKLFEVGEELEIGAAKGHLAGISPLHTLMENDGKIISIPNSDFLEKTARQ
ncbi:MAG: mechanosensitive ion channel [bacterium]|nr:mechanosensitive ion channel [bacterium]